MAATVPAASISGALAAAPSCFICEHCHYIASSFSELEHHQRKSGANMACQGRMGVPFNCAGLGCSATFSSLIDLAWHQYGCGIIRKILAQAGVLARVMADEAVDEDKAASKLFHCEANHCSITTTSLADLVRHEKLCRFIKRSGLNCSKGCGFKPSTNGESEWHEREVGLPCRGISGWAHTCSAIGCGEMSSTHEELIVHENQCRHVWNSKGY
ncbi:MAG: hypothetical protein Hyperionvirus6_15 [Hyperionvirus sp.]|uniref:C2H2-type domain-containing protein n=1 Tax=Hyperionvirus sp. TaxID=2487770 RepID=A0A3G5AA17_9VIRU|nr:MAG: hypothetical protein Hyperionvirus6_15 [Hyperionvirus sp.]